MNKLKTISNCIYAFINLTNGKIYIGQASNMYQRYYEHKKMRDKGVSLLHRAFQKYGFENFELKIIESDVDTGCMNEAETYYIKQFNASDRRHGYNICPTGYSTKGRIRPSSEMEGIKEYLKSCTGNKNHFYGRKHSLISRAKQSEIKKGKKWSLNQREKYLSSIKQRETPCNFKRIIQKDKKGATIKIWDTITQAAKELKIGISCIVSVANKTPIHHNGKIYCRKTAGGFVWEYTK